MPKQSAGLLLYRRREAAVEVFLVHPGGPFWKNKDAAAWSIPKGEFAPGDDALAAARREFLEETGRDVDGAFLPLAPVRQAGGKTVHAWAVEGECDPATIQSNSFELEWPRGSGRTATFPEVDRAGWFTIEEARVKMLSGQQPLLDQLLALL